MKYKGGRGLSKNAISAIRYVTKVGVMCRSTWYELFSHGTLRWKQMQLQHLVKSRVFKYHSCEVVNDAIVLDNFGINLVKEMNWQYVQPIPPQFIKHDETIATGLLKLETEKICTKWMTERELKMLRADSFKLDMKDHEIKYPDAVFKLQGQENFKVVALEYEKNGKSSWRYKKAIQAYRGSSEFDLILFIVDDQIIEARIKNAMRFISDGILNSKIGFISVDEWKLSPQIAMIRWHRDAKNLKKIVESM